MVKTKFSDVSVQLLHFEDEQTGTQEGLSPATILAQLPTAGITSPPPPLMGHRI